MRLRSRTCVSSEAPLFSCTDWQAKFRPMATCPSTGVRLNGNIWQAIGFSSKPTAAGTGVPEIAEMWTTLMERLGYERWVAQGGDWGSAVTTAIGRLATAADGAHGCVGIHLNMPVAAPTPEAMSDPSPADQAAMAAFMHYQEVESGYSKQQSTRPQTLGYGLTDSTSW